MERKNWDIIELILYIALRLKKKCTIKEAQHFLSFDFCFFFLSFANILLLIRKMASGIKIDSGYMWLGLYFILNLSLTLYNKIILNNFRFPYSLTAIHTLCGSVGCYLLYMMNIFTPAKLGDRENIIMVMFSILYTINIAISNVSL